MIVLSVTTVAMDTCDDRTCCVCACVRACACVRYGRTTTSMTLINIHSDKQHASINFKFNVWNKGVDPRSCRVSIDVTR